MITAIRCLMLLSAGLLILPGRVHAAGDSPRGGALQIMDSAGKPIGSCPLRNTDVEADIAGFVGRVTVTQVFHNPLDRKIEAVYVFPLPHNAAVDDMVMTVGDRRVVGRIKPREEARAIYDAAREAGHVAGLLDQERPNIFTQSVANIEPGVEVTIEISYVETLKYEEGEFEWVFPTVVGPRYMPGPPTSRVPPVAPEHQGKVAEVGPTGVQQGDEEPKGTGWSPDTDQVPDASRISPPVVKPGYRTGHDISLTVRINGGTPLHDLRSELHEVTIDREDDSSATVTLVNQTAIPNRDFVLRYRLSEDEIGDAFLVHNDERGRFFTLILHPPQRVLPEWILAREIIFVLDTSGSMRGFPIDKAKSVMAGAIDAMRAGDTFNLITFAGQTRILWDKPRPNTAENRGEAQTFLANLEGRGGTEMMKAINAALEPSEDNERMRIVCFMTDGYVGNDFAIMDAVQKNAATTRVFSFGIGNSVNRFLLDGMAHAGRGEVEYVMLESQGDAAAERFHQRIFSPVLTDIEIDWGDLPVADIYPKRIPDLFSAKPIMIHGRLTGPGNGMVTLRGETGEGPFERQVPIAGSAENDDSHVALASLWARAKVADLMMQDMGGMQHGAPSEDLRRQITAMGVEFRLMTQFTSFVAVEEMTVTIGGEATTIAVPVEMPQGVSYEGVFGKRGYPEAQAARGRGNLSQSMRLRRARVARKSPPPRSSGGGGGGGGGADGPRPPAFTPRNIAAAAQLAEPRPILAEPLRELAEKVSKEGKDGNLTVGPLRVTDYKINVMIYLKNTAPETLEALKKLGFHQSGESKAIHLLIGSIDVRRLEELAELDVVIHVAPLDRR